MAHRHLAVAASERRSQLIHGDRAAAVCVYGPEQLLQAVDLVGAQALGHDHQRSLFELVGCAQLAHALEHHAVERLVGRNALRPQPGVLHSTHVV